MASSIPPGRPGNLTAEQDAKLREMWAQLMDIFGVIKKPTSSDGASTTTTSTTTPDKKKNHRIGILGRKHKEADTESTESESNDKFGQTKEFQQALASQSPETLRETFWGMTKHDHPDALALRFLRARKWDVHAAIVMLVSTMHWRSTNVHIDDDIMKNGEGYAIRNSDSSRDMEDFMKQIRMGKSFLHSFDAEGRPCCIVRVRLHRASDQTEKSLERFTVHLMETARLLLAPPIDTATVIFDLTDFGMANMDYTPVKFMIKCFEANYPESLAAVLVYKAPWVFQGIWKIIRGWLDPVVAGKVHFANNVDELQQFIPKSRIMKELGGDDNYAYSYIEPSADEDSQMQDVQIREKLQQERTELVKSYEHEVLNWIQTGEDSSAARSGLAEQLAKNYWELDPYVRARSQYDRAGIIGKGGKVTLAGAPQSPPDASGTAESDLD